MPFVEVIDPSAELRKDRGVKNSALGRSADDRNMRHMSGGPVARRTNLDLDAFHLGGHRDNESADVAADIENDGSLTGMRIVFH